MPKSAQILRAGQGIPAEPLNPAQNAVLRALFSLIHLRGVPNSQEPGVAKEEITYESALREEGIDEKFVAKKLKGLPRAQGQRWNPKKGSWEKFEDHGTQLAALRRLPRFLAFTEKTQKAQMCRS